jgi:actin-related protein 6
MTAPSAPTPPSAVPSAARIIASKAILSARVKEEEGDPAAKKRKRVAPKKKKDASPPITQPPTHILVIDNGGDSLKYGLITSKIPESIPNLTAKLKHQWTVLVGDEVTQIQPTQVESLTRSTERSHITNLGNQVQVWKRILEVLKIHVPITTEASQVFGWKNNRQSTKEAALYQPQNMAVLLLMAPSSPRSTMESMYSIWFDDFQFGHVGFATSTIFAAAEMPISCVVDLGWSATYVVPTVNKRAIVEGIRRIPIGGRHMGNLWKYYMSYRQWNMMDSEFILRDVHEKLSYLSMDFDGDMRLAQQMRIGRRPFDRQFALPDFKNTFKGSVRLPPGMIEQQEIDTSEHKATEKENKLVTDDEPMAATIEKRSKESEDDVENPTGGDDDEDEDEVDSEDENMEQRKVRLLRQKAEEERRKRELDEEEQLLEVSVERFAIPEVLFRPTDAGFPSNMAGLPQAIVYAIQACPRHYQAALYGSIRLVGGTSKLQNMKERLERDLRSLAPIQYDVKISMDDFPVEQAWLGASKWAKDTPFHLWSICREEYEATKTGPIESRAWSRLYHGKGGYLI